MEIQASGSLISADLHKTLKTGALSQVEAVFVPDEKQSFQNFFLVDDAVYLFILENVSGQLLRSARTAGAWTNTKVSLPDLGTLLFVAGNARRKELLVAFENLTTPPTLFRVSDLGRVTKLRSLPAMIDPSRLVVEQKFAISKDGTRIPYFIARPKDFVFNGTRPALLTGYGGFRSSFLPRYLGGSACELAASILLERGGAFVTANLRGGGEYGPLWHQSGILEKKQNTWDDFAAVAEDLVRTGLTSRRRLGITGASHGGLLVGVALTQHPSLFRAVWCEVPGLDMLRYHVLFSSGAMADYGNPDDPKMRPIIRNWSPYHNLKEKTAYPTVLFVTNSRDDRVHPAHARKMYAKMLDLGADVHFYEAGEGGHGYGAGIEGIAHRNARMATFFISTLFDKP